MTSLLRASAVCVVLSSCACANPMVAPSPAPTVASSPTLSSISVAMGAASQPASQPQRIQMIATGRFSDTDYRDLTSLAAWESSNPGVATVSATGLLTYVSDGETTITATYQGKSGSKPLAFMNPSPWDY